MKRFILISAFVLSSFVLAAQSVQEDKDSLVSLLSAQSMQLIEKDEVPIRKVIGPARFFHNNTYLLCDTALWNVNKKMIHAMGHVKVIQNETILTSDSLHYDIDQDLAMFRGTLVQLQDKDLNTLRSNDLDYNTKDSIAFFRNGAAMRDKDGQLIESLEGEYVTETKTFHFRKEVEMFTDSIFIKTDDLIYYTQMDSVTFNHGIHAWQEDNMLSSRGGWYARNKELFFFKDRVHGMNPDKEVWCDSLYYDRLTNNMEMLGNVQLVDTVRRATAMGGRIFYTDSTSSLLMSRRPVAVGEMEDAQGRVDSVWFGADTLKYRSMMKFEVPEGVFEASKARMENLESDAVQAYRRKAAEAAAAAAKKAQEEDPDYQMKMARQKMAGQSKAEPSAKEEESVRQDMAQTIVPGKDSLSVTTDSLALIPDSLSTITDSLHFMTDSLISPLDSTVVAGADSLSVVADTIPVLDSTKIGFFTGVKNVKVFKSDMQILTDSLEICEVDSLVRLYQNPVIWDQIERQYSSDSLFILTHDNQLDKANLLSNAFIIVHEDTLCFDQIRSTEMMAYFDSTSALRRFDALGGANAIFYLKEDSTYATVNVSKAKMLSATFVAGDIDHVYYYEATGSDAYPLAQMKKDDTILKGFKWMPERRPKSRYEISSARIRPSERKIYAACPKTAFVETNLYFPGYIPGIYDAIEAGKIAKARHRAMEQARQDSLDRISVLKTDSLQVADTLEVSDSLKNHSDSLAVQDSLQSPVQDSLSTVKDSLSVDREQTPEELKAAKRKEKEEKARLKLEEKEKKWARLDSLDAAKERAKAEKKAEKLRAKKRKALIKAMKEEQADQLRLERYIEHYRKKKLRLEAKLEKRKQKSLKTVKVQKQLDKVNGELKVLDAE